ncbi:MAG: hypothetical protein ABSB78_07970 [Bacteroidota bacterium]
MAPGIKKLSLFLLAIAFSGAITSSVAQEQNSSQSDRTAIQPRPDRPIRTPRTADPVSDRGTSQQGRNPGTEQQGRNPNLGRPITVPKPQQPANPDPMKTVVLPVPVLVEPVQTTLSQVDVIREDVYEEPALENFDGWAPRWKVGYTANITSYGIGAHLMIPMGAQANSEFFIRLGIALFSKSTKFIIDGNSYEAASGLLPLALMVKTTHYSVQNSYGEFRIYSAVGGGPVLGMAVPKNFDKEVGGPFTRWGLGGELFGAIGTEFVLNGNVGYYAEAGFSYLTFAGHSFSTTQQFLSPTLSLGIRFY